MKRQGLFFAIAALLMVVSVSAQDKLTTGTSDLPSPTLITIQDDNTRSFLIFSITDGQYKFFRCKDQFSMSGTGKVKVSGCQITFEDIKTDRRVLASVDECTQIAKASIALVSPTPSFTTQPVKDLLIDSDMRDSTTDCTVKIDPQH